MQAQHQTMKTTNVQYQEVTNYRVTLPRPLARAIDIYERDDQRAHYEATCDGDGLALTITFDPDAPDHKINTASKVIRSSGGVLLEIPTFLADVWSLRGCKLGWPNPEDVAADADERVQFRVEVEGWEPRSPVESLGPAADYTAITTRGSDRSGFEGTFPIDLAEQVGIVTTDEETGTVTARRVEISFDCVDGQRVLVATPTDAERSDVPNSLAVHLAGPQNRQARFAAKLVSAELGVFDESYAGESPRIAWRADGDRLLGTPEGGA